MKRFLLLVLVPTIFALIGSLFDSGNGIAMPQSWWPSETEQLVISETITATVGSTVTVPINFNPMVDNVAGLAFSVDYDERCLAFDPSDVDHNGLPDAVHIFAPAAFNRIFFVDISDIDGELDTILIDFIQPYSSLPALTPLMTITFEAVCTPEPGTSTLAAVAFSHDPGPTYTTDDSQTHDATTRDGSVLIINDQPLLTPTATSTPTLAVVPTRPSPTPTTTPTFVPTVQPVTVVEDFTAEYQDSGILLRWRTSREEKTQSFSIHRATLGQNSTFSPIAGAVAGRGNQGGTYMLLDEDIETNVLYSYLLIEEKLNGRSIPYYDLLLLIGPLKADPSYQILLPVVRR